MFDGVSAVLGEAEATAIGSTPSPHVASFEEARQPAAPNAPTSSHTRKGFTFLPWELCSSSHLSARLER
jgi:hypothetical protein